MLLSPHRDSHCVADSGFWSIQLSSVIRNGDLHLQWLPDWKTFIPWPPSKWHITVGVGFLFIVCLVFFGPVCTPIQNHQHRAGIPGERRQSGFSKPYPLPHPSSHTHTNTHLHFTFCSNISRITCLLPAGEPPQRPQWSGMCCRVNAAPETEREICPPVSQELWGSRPSEFIEWASGCDNSAAAVSAQVLCVLTFGWLRIDQLAAISEHWSLRGARGSSLLSSSLLLATLTRRFFFFVCFFKKIPAQILKCFKKQSHSCLSTYAGYQVHSKIEVI